METGVVQVTDKISTIEEMPIQTADSASKKAEAIPRGANGERVECSSRGRTRRHRQQLREEPQSLGLFFKTEHTCSLARFDSSMEAAE